MQEFTHDLLSQAKFHLNQFILSRLTAKIPKFCHMFKLVILWWCHLAP